MLPFQFIHMFLTTKLPHTCILFATLFLSLFHRRTSLSISMVGACFIFFCGGVFILFVVSDHFSFTFGWLLALISLSWIWLFLQPLPCYYMISFLTLKFYEWSWYCWLLFHVSFHKNFILVHFSLSATHYWLFANVILL